MIELGMFYKTIGDRVPTVFAALGCFACFCRALGTISLDKSIFKRTDIQEIKTAEKLNDIGDDNCRENRYSFNYELQEQLLDKNNQKNYANHTQNNHTDPKC